MITTATIAAWVAKHAVSLAIAAASIAVQAGQASKMRKKSKAAAEARKGFELIVDGSAESLPIVYGRAKVGGVRAYHNTNSSFLFEGSNSDKVFSSGSASTPGGSYSYTYRNSSGDIITDVVNYSGRSGQALDQSINGSKNEFLFFQQALCQGPIQGVYDLIINDSQDINDPSFGHTATQWVYKGGSFIEDKDQQAAYRIDCHYHTGNDAVISANFPDRRSAVFTGLAHIAGIFRIDRDEPQFNAVPNVQAIIEGRKVYTIVRSGTIGAYNYSLSGTRTYSNNPAYCLLDYLMDPLCGKKLQVGQIHLESFFNAAQLCATIVQTGASVGGKVWKPLDGSRNITTRDIPLYECNLIVDTTQPIRENVEQILSTMGDARLLWSQGQYKLSLQYPGVNANIVVADTITDDRLLFGKSIEITQPGASDRLNRCTIRFNNEAENFREDSVSWPPKVASNTKRGIGGKRFAPMSGWDTTKTGGIFLNSYGVWDGAGTTTNLTYKFVPKETGLYQLSYTGDNSISISVNGTGFATASNWEVVSNGSINLTQNTIVTITITGSDSGGFRGVGATLRAPSGVIDWSTRSDTYDSFVDINNTTELHQQFLLEDNGVILETSMFVDGIVDYYHALAKAEELVRMSRTAAAVKFEYQLSDVFPEPGDIIELRSDMLGIGVESDFFIRLTEVRLSDGNNCEITGTRFDASQLAWNVKDSEYIKPPNIYTFGLTAPLSVTYTQGYNQLKGSPGTLSWSSVDSSNLSGYIVYFHEFGQLDISGQPIFKEVGRASKSPFPVPNLGSVVGTWGVAAYSGTSKSAITPASLSTVDRIDSALNPPTLPFITRDLTGDFEQAVVLGWTSPTVRQNGLPYSDHKYAIIERAKIPDPLPEPWSGPVFTPIGVSITDMYIDPSPEFGQLQYRVRLESTRDLRGEWTTASPVFLDPLKASSVKTALVYAYKRAPTLPLDNPGDVTYDFALKSIVDLELADGWSKTIPEGLDPLYVVAATALSGGPEDDIESEEWSAPVALAQNGINSATLYLYKRASTSTVSPVSSDGTPATYNFSTGVITNVPSGWSTVIPETGGEYLFVSQATAVSAGETDSIPDSEWALPAVLAKDGVDGLPGEPGLPGDPGDPGQPGLQAHKAELYQWQVAQPGLPTGNSVLTWGSMTLSLPVTPNGWSTTVPANPGTPGIRLWILSKTVSALSTATSSTVDWSTGASVVAATANGTNGTNGGAGTNGYRTAKVAVYAWALSIPSPPSGSATYTWATGALSSVPSGWQSAPGSAPKGMTLWKAEVNVADNATTPASNVDWSQATVSAAGYSAVDGKSLTLSATSQLFRIDKAGTVSPSTITFTANGVGLTGSPSFSVTSGTLTGSGTTRSLAYENMTADAATIQVTWDGLSDTITVVKVREGSDSYVAVLTNEAALVPADSSGNVTSFSGAGGTMLVYKGTQLLTSGVSYGRTTQSGVHTNIDAVTGVYSASSMSASSGTATMVAAISGGPTLEKTFSVAKVIAGPTGGTGPNGQQGASARRSYTLTASTSLGSGNFTYTGDVLPPAGTWGGGTWSASASAPAAGQTLYQSDGIYNPATNQTTWTTPYVSSLKVGSLSAITVSTGALSVDGMLSVGAGGAIKSGSYTGWGWPASGTGFYLGTQGLLMGNHDTGGGFVSISADGSRFDLGIAGGPRLTWSTSGTPSLTLSNATLNAASGNINAINVTSSGHIRGGQTGYATGSGFFLGYASGYYRFSIGDDNQYLRWTGTELQIKLNQMTLSANSPGSASFTLGNANRLLGTVAVGVSGGKLPYTYQWTLVGVNIESATPGDNAGFISGGTSSSCSFYGRGNTNCGIGVTAVCFVTDANGQVASISRGCYGSFGSGPP